METVFATARTFLVVWSLFCYATTTSFAQQENIATGVIGDEGIIRSEVVSHTTMTMKQKEKEGIDGDRGLLLHPKAPPRPRMEDTPPDSTRLSLQLDDGFEWVVVIKTDITESELRVLLNRICEESGQRSARRGARYAAEWASMQNGYDRTVFWFEISGSRDVFETYLDGLISSAADRAINALEVGSFEGASAVWFAKHLLLHPESALLCLDTWMGSEEFKNNDFDMPAVENRFKRNIASTPNNERVSAIKGDSLLTLSELVAGGASSTFDVVYVDGSHAMVNALSDGILSFRLLKVGGFIIFDDIVTFPEVGRATDLLVEALGGEDRLEVLYRKEQLVLRKTAEDRWATPTSKTISWEAEAIAHMTTTVPTTIAQ